MDKMIRGVDRESVAVAKVKLCQWLAVWLGSKVRDVKASKDDWARRFGQRNR